jgi:ubiquinone/menaquinone biosynthesis C-methylase UbiE
MTSRSYVFENASTELQRLVLQATILRPITERLLRAAQLGRGMRVLDLGCGVGDVSLLAGEMVGPSGSVVGIDRDPEAVATAVERARERGLSQLVFNVATIDEFPVSDRFDLAIGRYVLVHQPDPAGLIRAAARHVKPNGVIGFHEISLYESYHSLPVVPIWERTATLLDTAFRHGAPSWDAAGRMVEHFMNAGLPCPDLFAEVPIGGGESSPLYQWLAETARSLMPRLLKLGAVNEEDVSIDALEARLRADVVAARSQVEFPAQVCAWARVQQA